VADAPLFELVGPVGFRYALGNNLDVTILLVSRDRRSDLNLLAANRALAPAEPEARPLLRRDQRFLDFRQAALRAAEARARLEQLQADQLPALEKIVQEQRSVREDTNLSAEQLGARLAKLTAREQELLKAQVDLKAGLQILDSRVDGLRPAAALAEGAALATIHIRREAAEKRLAWEVPDRLVAAVEPLLVQLYTAQLAAAFAATSKFPDEAGLLDRLALEPDDPEAEAAAAEPARAAAV
jgi:hypothetical protein